MIVYVQSMWSKEEINADSNYVVWSQFLRAAPSDVYFVVAFPTKDSGFKYEDDGTFTLPNVTRVPYRVPARRVANASHFNANWYESLFRSIAFDVIWSHLPEISGQIRASGRTTREPISKPGLVTQHNYVVHDTLPYEFHTHLALAELAGSIVSDVNVFNSDHCLAMFMDNAIRFLSHAAIRDLEPTIERIDYGTVEPDIPTIPERPVDHVPVIAYNHRLLSHKNWRTTFTILDELHQEGVPFRLRFMNNTAEKVGAIRGYPWVEVVLSPTRKEYLAALRGCDLNVIHSDHETFCIAAAESMAMGQPLVAPNGVTFPEITGRKAGNEYPWLFDSAAESKDMIRTLLRDGETRRRWGMVAAEHVRSHYTTDRWVPRYLDAFARSAEHTVGTHDNHLDKIREGLRVNHGKTIGTLYTWLSSKAGHVEGRHVFGTQTTTLTKLMRLIRHVGGRVTIEGGAQLVWKG